MKFDFIAKPYIPFAIIAIVGFLLYGQTLFFGYTYLDDTSLIVDNAAFLGRPSSIIDSFRYDVGGPPTISPGGFGFYRPVLTLSFIANYTLGGVEPFIYHLTNVLLHIIAVELLFVLLCAFALSRQTSFAFAIIFLVHPMALAVTAWIPGRNDALLAIGVFASLLFFIGFWRDKKIAYFVAHQAFFLFALFTKETAFVLPLICVLYVACLTKERVFKIDWRRMALIACWAVSLGVWFLARQNAMFEDNQVISPSGALGAIIMNAPGALSYIEKIFLPFRLSVYPIRQDLSVLPGFLILLVLMAGFAVSTPRGRRVMAFGLLWFVVFIIPGLVNTQPVLKVDFAEHRAYIPFLGIILFISQVSFLPKISTQALRLWAPVFLSVLLLVLCGINFYHARAYRDAEHFWHNAIETSPHASAAHNGLGAYYYIAQDLLRAEEEFKRAIALNDAGSEHHYNLGMIYFQKKMYDEARSSFENELAINASYIKAYLNLGAVYYFEGNMQKAEEVWLEGLKINPDYHDIHNNLAFIYYQQGDIEKALRHARIVLESDGQLREQVYQALMPYLGI